MAAFQRATGRAPTGAQLRTMTQSYASMGQPQLEALARSLVAAPAMTLTGAGPAGLSFGGGFSPAPIVPPMPTGGWRGAIGGVVTAAGGAAAGAAGEWFRRQLGGGGGSAPRLPVGPTSSNGPAPTATFFGGECPPGRVLRRVSMGRDICIKKPRMNPFNPRALARADRRVTSFARRSKAILSDMGYTVTARKKSLGKKRKRR